MQGFTRMMDEDQENMGASFSNIQRGGALRDPLQALAQAKEELDEEAAYKYMKQSEKEDAALLRMQEELGHKEARRIWVEERDALVALQMQEREQWEHDCWKKEQEALLAKDQQLVRQLSRTSLEEVQERRRLAEQDAALAAKLQREEESELSTEEKELHWVDPPVHFEEHADEGFLMFWIKLPNLKRAGINISHEESGNAVINIQAVPTKNSVVHKTFSVDLRLNSTESLDVSSKDLRVSYDERSSVLEIRCLNLRLEDSIKAKLLRGLRNLFK